MGVFSAKRQPYPGESTGTGRGAGQRCCASPACIEQWACRKSKLFPGDATSGRRVTRPPATEGPSVSSSSWAGVDGIHDAEQLRAGDEVWIVAERDEVADTEGFQQHISVAVSSHRPELSFPEEYRPRGTANIETATIPVREEHNEEPDRRGRRAELEHVPRIVTLDDAAVTDAGRLHCW